MDLKFETTLLVIKSLLVSMLVLELSIGRRGFFLNIISPFNLGAATSTLENPGASVRLIGFIARLMRFSCGLHNHLTFHHLQKALDLESFPPFAALLGWIPSLFPDRAEQRRRWLLCPLILRDLTLQYQPILLSINLID